MIDLMVPVRQAATDATTGGFLSGLMRAVTAVPAGLDPDRQMWRPGEHDRHRVRQLAIPLGGTTVPGLLLVPHRSVGATVVVARGGVAADNLTHARWVRALLERSLNVLVFDLDGHGANPRPLAVPGIEEDLPAVLAFARTQPEIDPRRMGLLGFDLGGACALRAAADDPAVRAVVTVGSAHRLQLDEWSQVGEAIGLLNPEFARTWLQGTPALVNAVLGTRVRIAGSARPEPLPLNSPPLIQAVAAALRHLNPLDSATALSHAPLLVVHGEWDCLTPPWQAEALHLRASGPRELMIVPRRNHLTLLLSRRAVQGTADFLKGHL